MEPIFYCSFLTKYLSKSSSSTKPPQKHLLCVFSQALSSFAKRSILNVWQCSENVCLDNCSVICKVTWYYVLHQTHSKFWHIQHSCFFRYIQAYLESQAYSKHWNIDQANSEPCHRTDYLSIIQPYSGTFKTLCNVCIYRNLVYSESWNIQSSSKIASWGILRPFKFTKIDIPCVTLEIQNLSIPGSDVSRVFFGRSFHKSSAGRRHHGWRWTGKFS